MYMNQAKITRTRKGASVQKLQEQIRRWEAEIEMFKAKADQANALARSQYESMIDRLQAKIKKTKQQIRLIKSAGGLGGGQKTQIERKM